MSENVFTLMSSDKMAHLISTASERVVVAVPAIREKVATALVEASLRLGMGHVAIVVDCDDEVFRLGYGDFAAVQMLREHGVEIRQCSGLRVGVLICDARAWVFTPTALYVQPEVHSDETPNAVQLTGSDVDRLLVSIIPAEPDDTSVPEAADAPEMGNGLVSDEAEPHEGSNADVVGTPEIGNAYVSDAVIAKTGESLEVAPPIAFDIARQVRVFQPYIQYLEISLKGCSIQRKRVTIPKSIQKLQAKDIEDRLQTTFELIEKSSSVSSRKLEDELNQVRDDFTRSLGKPWGRVILKTARSIFDERIKALRERLAQHKEQVQAELEKHLVKSKEAVVDYYLPLFEKEPPDALLGQLLYS